jgi:hypothetical protein
LTNGDTIAVNLGTVMERRCARWSIWHGVLPGVKSFPADAPRREGDPAVLVANAKKASEVLSWTRNILDLAAIIGDAWRWHNSDFDS